MAALEQHEDRLTVLGVFVPASRRRAGVGSRLLSEAATLASGRLGVLAGAGSRAEKSLLEALGYRAELLLMTPRHAPPAPAEAVPCAGAVVIEGDALLLIRRGHEPALGRWSLPGGRVERGETFEQAAVREVLEETGLLVEVGEEVGSARLETSAGTFEVHNFAARVLGGDPGAGSDAAAVRFASRDELGLLPLSDGLIDWLERTGVLARLEGSGGR